MRHTLNLELKIWMQEPFFYPTARLHEDETEKETDMMTAKLGGERNGL